MINKYEKRHSVVTFAICDYVTLFIPRQDRSATDDHRLPAVITLHAAAKAASRNFTGSVRARCNCKTTCSTKRCSCIKAGRQCTNNE